ncbi:MAG TPA: hypothetical protein VE960_06620 [bacterium]|nr:hypothetical protein [bacterium]
MSDAVLAVGEKVHVVTRRAFPEDVRRHFVGTVQAISDGAIKLEGYAFVLRGATNEYERRPEKRVRVLSLSDTGSIINVLPESVHLEDLAYEFASGRLLMTDGAGYELELTEFGPGA